MKGDKMAKVILCNDWGHEQVDSIYYNGNFRTLDKSVPEAQAIAVKNGIIFKIGSNKDILNLANTHTAVIDLNNGYALPGFSDSHFHLVHYANTKRKVELSGARSLADIIDLCIKGLHKRQQENGWLLGCGWNQDYWHDAIFPSKGDLDKVSTEIPIAITRTCYHVTVVNSKALEILGLDKNIPILTNGIVCVDENGEANGILLESAQNIVSKYLGIPGLDKIKDMILDACMDVAAAGITSIHTDDFEAFSENTSDLIIQAYQELAREGKLPIRIYQQCMFKKPEYLKEFLMKGYKTGNEYGFYKIGPLKLLNDGSLGARTAFLSRPYRDAPNQRGVCLYSQDDLMQMIQIGHNGGMQIAIHCIGDAAIKMAIGCFEAVMIAHPRIDARHGIVHCQITDMSIIEKVKALNLLVYAQPIFMRYDREIILSRVGADLAATSYNWRAYTCRNVHLSGGSDCPVEKFDIMPNIYCAVTGKNPENNQDMAWHPENCLTLDEAVCAFTIEGAYASFQENERGTVSIGKYADIVVLNKDIYKVNEDQIKDIKVKMTIVNGSVKYRN